MDLQFSLLGDLRAGGSLSLGHKEVWAGLGAVVFWTRVATLDLYEEENVLTNKKVIKTKGQPNTQS